MKFFSILALASASFSSVLAAPSNAPALEERALGLSSASRHQLPAAQALAIVKSLNTVLDQHNSAINTTVASYKSKKTGKQAAINAVSSQMSAMTHAVNQAVGEIGQKARGANLSKRDAEAEASMDIEERANPAQALAQALKHTLITAAGTVNTALAVLGLTPLLAFLTPLTGSLSGLVLTLKAVVDALLPLLNIILDGVVLGLSGLLAGLIL